MANDQPVASAIIPLLREAKGGRVEVRRALLPLVQKVKDVTISQAIDILHALSHIPSSMNAVRHIWSLVQHKQINIIAVSAYARAAVGNNNPQEAFATLDLIKSLNIKPDSHYYGVLLSACALGKRSYALKKALSLLRGMKADGVEPSIHNYSTMIQICAKHGNVIEALKIMDMVEAAGLPFDGPLLTALVSVCATDIEYARKGYAVLSLMQQKGLVPDLATYNALLKCCSMSSDVAGMQHIFSLMKEQGLKPDEFTMRSIMSGQLHRQNIKGALDIVTDFRNQHGIQPTIRTYTDLMMLCKRMGDLETAVELMDKMKADQVEPSWSCYTALSHLYASRGDVVNASRVQQEMQEQSDLPATQANMGSLITAVGLRLKPGEPLDEVYRLVDRIKSDRDMPPDLATFSPLITSYLKADRIDDAWAVQQAMIERYGVQPDKVLNKIFLFALEERGDVSRIEVVFDRMCQRPDTFFFHRKALSLLCLHRLQKENDPMRACEVLEELRKRNFAYKVDQRVTPALLRLIRELLWRNNCHQALNVFGFLRRQQPPPTASNFTFLFQRCVRPRHLPVLYKFRRAMQEIGIPFNVESALAYLQALCRSGRINEAVGFIHSMEREHHVSPLIQHYNAVLRESMEAQDTDMARRVLEVMEENSVHGDEFTDEVRRQLAASPRATRTASTPAGSPPILRPTTTQAASKT